jgi:hypothetical protein
LYFDDEAIADISQRAIDTDSLDKEVPSLVGLKQEALEALCHTECRQPA